MRSIERHDVRGTGLIVGLLGAMVLAWGYWFFAFETGVFVVSESARLEVDRDVVPLQVWTGGRIVSHRLELGREVEAGETLLELDATAVEIELRQARALRQALAAQQQALDAEIAARGASLDAERRAGAGAIDEQRLEQRALDTDRRRAEREAEILGELHEDGQLSELELVRATAEAERQSDLAAASKRGVASREHLEQAARRRGEAELAALNSQRQDLVTRQATARGEIDRLELELRRHRLLAPAAGRLADVRGLRLGELVAAAEEVGTILPRGRLELIAELSPATALGRVRPDQPGRFRAAFTHGRGASLPCTVRRVAAEPRGGTVRVVLALDGETPGDATLDDLGAPRVHGLPGTVEIEIERLSPFKLLLRELGRN